MLAFSPPFIHISFLLALGHCAGLVLCLLDKKNEQSHELFVILEWLFSFLLAASLSRD